MNKELQKLLKQINDKKNEVKSLVNDGKLDKARAAKEELVELQNRFDLLYDLDEDEQDGIENKVKDGTAKQVGGDVKPDKKNIVKSFVNIVKAGFLHKEADEADIKVYKDALTSDTTAGSEGEVGIGVTIPEDIRTDIIELRRSSDNLEQYVNVEGVTTKTGTRNIEVDAESTPFDNVDEAADFPEMDEPEFLPIEYKVKKKGGILKMTLDFMGFQFYHDKTILRESIMLSCTRKVNRVAKKEKITWYDATAILSYMGYLSNTDTYDMYLQRVKPYVNVKKLKKIVSKHSKRKEREKHERMERSVRNGGRTAGGVRHNSVTDNGISETQYQESNERGCRRKENHRMAARGA